MKHTKEEIINALKIIKDECTNCKNCPFGDSSYMIGTYCKLLRSDPCGWEINDTPPQIWRALK